MPRECVGIVDFCWNQRLLHRHKPTSDHQPSCSAASSVQCDSHSVCSMDLKTTIVFRAESSFRLGSLMNPFRRTWCTAHLPMCLANPLGRLPQALPATCLAQLVSRVFFFASTTRQLCGQQVRSCKGKSCNIEEDNT